MTEKLAPKYLKYVCPSCNTLLALETKAIKKKCTVTIGIYPNGKPIKCGAPLPSQKKRDEMEKSQYHDFSPI
jgi:hypothetical protein